MGTLPLLITCVRCLRNIPQLHFFFTHLCEALSLVLPLHGGSIGRWPEQNTKVAGLVWASFWFFSWFRNVICIQLLVFWKSAGFCFPRVVQCGWCSSCKTLGSQWACLKQLYVKACVLASTSSPGSTLRLPLGSLLITLMGMVLNSIATTPDESVVIRNCTNRYLHWLMWQRKYFSYSQWHPDPDFWMHGNAYTLSCSIINTL